MILAYESAAALLSEEQLGGNEVRGVLAPVGFADWRAAWRCLRRMADIPRAASLLAAFLPHLLVTLSGAADPDRVLVDMERFTRSAADRLAALEYLASNPRAVEILVTLFAGSQFLTEILLRNPEYLARLVAHRHLAQRKTADQLYREAQAALAAGETAREPASTANSLPISPLDALRRFQRWELLRIGTCDLLNLLDLSAVTVQLSNLADSLVRACLSIAAGPSSAKGFAVIGMGKLGGRELNYSSDIDLLFLAASNAGDYRRLGERLIEALMRMTAEGFLYRVDMRLRPWGEEGLLVTSVAGYVAYLNRHARLWEKQALLKARVIAGDEGVGQAFLDQAGLVLFAPNEGPAEAATRAHVRTMKQRTEDRLRQRGREWGEVKLGEGSIRDIEFVTQFLQLVHGARLPQIRSRNTLDALGHLFAHRLLSADEHRVLVDGYVFMRTIEHHLQMMHYRQTHLLPTDRQALLHLARRLGFQGDLAGDQFLAHYEEHRAAIRAVYLRHLGSDDMAKTPGSETNPASGERASAEKPGFFQHLSRMDPSYAAAFDDQEIRLHATLAEQLNGDHLVEVHAVPLDEGYWRLTIVGYDYPGVLSLICGLLFVYGSSIRDGNAFTYEPDTLAKVGPAKLAPTFAQPSQGSEGSRERLKIVDVFTVYPERSEVTGGTWLRYADDLAALLRLMHAGQRNEAQIELAKRVAATLHGATEATLTLYPIDIEIDNTVSELYTVLRIDAPDTIGFLYEFTHALAFNRVYIARVGVNSVGDRVQDILYVTDADGHKIVLPERQRQLRAATVLIKHFTHLLPHSPNPESALLHFRQFLGQLFERPDWPDELASLERPEVLHALAQVLGVSDFLWDDFLRMQHANLFPVVRDVDGLATAKSREQLQAELETALRLVHAGPQPPAEDAPWRATLNAFKDREMFRVDMRHILGHTSEFGEFSEELTSLAEVVVNAAYHLCHEDLRVLYGTPCLEDGRISEMTVCALGKCGGRELGFASDIELMFIYAGNGTTTGGAATSTAITTAEFYEKVVETFVSAIQARREGIFQVDLQLRPYGKSSSMAVSLEGFRRYFAPDGPAWAYERQALVKLRPIAGDEELGQQVVALRDAFVYAGDSRGESHDDSRAGSHDDSRGSSFDVVAMRAMRERQIRHLVTGGTFNAKFSPGGLVDVEYLVQALQITYGHRDPSLRQTNIREAMAALAAAGILSSEDYARLRRAHTFLRWLIDALRMVRGNARDLTVPPAGSEGFAFLARRLRYGNDVARLREDLEHHTTAVQELNARLLG